MAKILVFAAALAVLPASLASARSAPPSAPPATVQQLIACRSIADPGQRLACYDRATTAIDQALAKRDIVVVDKQKAAEAKRSLFGFSVPNFGALFGGGDEDIDSIQSTITGARQNGDGGWLIVLADGSTWTQTDDRPVAIEPRHGDKVEVRRGALGSYFLRIGSRPGFKVKRVG